MEIFAGWASCRAWVRSTSRVNAWDCASLVGWFVIDHQFYFLGSLTTIDLRFELRCGGFGAPLRGQVHWAE